MSLLQPAMAVLGLRACGAVLKLLKGPQQAQEGCAAQSGGGTASPSSSWSAYARRQLWRWRACRRLGAAQAGLARRARARLAAEADWCSWCQDAAICDHV